jgi:hypothetical protein
MAAYIQPTAYSMAVSTNPTAAVSENEPTPETDALINSPAYTLAALDDSDFALIEGMSRKQERRAIKAEQRVLTLEAAIREHRDNITHPHADDQTLWAALGGEGD